MRLPRLLIATTLLASLAGCGGSSPSAPGAAGGGNPPAPQGRSFGTRNVPGGTIAVSTAGPLQPGAANPFRLALSGGMPAPATVSAWIAAAYDAAAVGTLATPVAGAAGSYDVALALPAPLPAGSNVWVRLGFADGSLIETGGEDFPLAGQ
jgi:hypothetical protein